MQCSESQFTEMTAYLTYMPLALKRETSDPLPLVDTVNIKLIS